MYEFLEYRVEDAMTPEVIVVSPERRLSELEDLFERHEFNGVPVVDPQRRLLGWVTKLDVLKAFRFDDEHMFPPYEEIMKQPVSSVMVEADQIRTVTPREPLTKVLEKLVSQRAKSFPVADADGVVVGVVAREDVLRALRKAASGVRAGSADAGTADSGTAE